MGRYYRQRTVFPTHDPEGYPLPNLVRWPVALSFLPFGVILIIAGTVSSSMSNTRPGYTSYTQTYNRSNTGFYAMIGVGVTLILASIGFARFLYARNVKNTAEWAAANPDAARALEARGGIAAVPRLLMPNPYFQQPGMQQVVVVQQQQQAVPNVYGGNNGGYQPFAGAAPAPYMTVQNGAAVYPQQQQPVSEMNGGTTTVVTVVSNGYFYRPEFSGRRLTPEQMAGGVFSTAMVMPVGINPAMYQQQQQAVPLMYAQQNVAVGQPMMGGAAVYGSPAYGAVAKPADDTPTYSQVLASSSNTANIPGFGLPV